MDSGYRPRVNGKLQGLEGHDVLLLGTVIKVDSAGKNLTVRASDGSILMVIMKQPVSQPVKDLVVEFEGKVTGRNTMAADSFTAFPADMTKSFNFDQYNEFVGLTNAEFVKNNYAVIDISEHHGSGPDPEIITSPADNREEMGEFGEKSFLLDDMGS